MRGDGSSFDWAFPTYGEHLPHDLCHLVVENLLGISGGFWGLVEQGMDVQLVDNKSALFVEGRPVSEVKGFDTSDLLRAEDAVASIAPFGTPIDFVETTSATARAESAVVSARGEGARTAGGILRPGTTPEDIAAVIAALRELQTLWQGLDDGGSISLDLR